MTKRGGFPGGIPGNVNNLIKQIQRVQRQTEKATEELETKKYITVSDDGAVSVTVLGKKEAVSVKLSEEVVSPGDIEMLEDLIVATTSEVFHQMEVESSETMSKPTGELGGTLGEDLPFR